MFDAWNDEVMNEKALQLMTGGKGCSLSGSVTRSGGLRHRRNRKHLPVTANENCSFSRREKTRRDGGTGKGNEDGGKKREKTKKMSEKQMTSKRTGGKEEMSQDICRGFWGNVFHGRGKTK